MWEAVCLDCNAGSEIGSGRQIKLEGKFTVEHKVSCSSCFVVQILFSGRCGEPPGMSEYGADMAEDGW